MGIAPVPQVMLVSEFVLMPAPLTALAPLGPQLTRIDPGPAGPTPAGATTSERRLIARAQNGSPEAIEELFRRYWRRAYRAAWMITSDAAAAEDIAQESFLAALHALERFDHSRPFGPWLHRIVSNRSIDWTRARRIRAELVADVESRSGGDPEAPPEDPRAEGLRDALDLLSPEHRTVIAMRYVLELTPAEISKTLAIPRGTVNSRLRRALDALGAALGAP